MEQLVQMRQRIKAVETVKKITHAMRLISISSHSRLRQKKGNLELYRTMFQQLWARIKLPDRQLSGLSGNLYILIGSQKGLCGSFNTMLFKFFEAEVIKKGAPFDTIVIGKHAVDYAVRTNYKPLATFATLSAQNFVEIAYAVTKLILQHIEHYQSIIIYSNYSRTFFTQKPRYIQLAPVLPVSDSETTTAKASETEYIWEQSMEDIQAYVKKTIMAITIQEALFESLLAEQAARFLSMDAATRNADKLLSKMKLDYNKMRQAIITRELGELSSSL